MLALLSQGPGFDPQLGHFFTDISHPTICFVHLFLFILIDPSFFIFLFLFLPPKSTF